MSFDRQAGPSTIVRVASDQAVSRYVARLVDALAEGPATVEGRGSKVAHKIVQALSVVAFDRGVNIAVIDQHGHLDGIEWTSVGPGARVVSRRRSSTALVRVVVEPMPPVVGVQLEVHGASSGAPEFGAWMDGGGTFEKLVLPDEEGPGRTILMGRFTLADRKVA